MWDVAPAEYVGNSSNRPILSERAAFSTALTHSVTFASDGARIISASRNGFIRIWDAFFDAKGQQESFWGRGGVYAISVGADGLRVASSAMETEVRL